MKAAILSYHKNANELYQPSWIQDYRMTVLGQTKSDLPIFELNYGGDNYRVFTKSYFESVAMPTFVHALNYLLDKVFSAGYDCAFNSNLDDTYASTWIEKTLEKIEAGYELVSTNFVLFDENGMIKKHHFDKLNIEHELANNHNVICHPSCCYARSFHEKGNRYIPEQQPLEDLMLWQRAIKNSKFIILPEHLCYHRIHDNSVCQSNNR